MQRPAEKFGPVAIALHWTIALALILSVLTGLGYAYIDDTRTSRTSLELHQSIGFLIFLLALARLYWRITHTPPPPPTGYTRAQRMAAAVTHATLYLFIIGMPISGYTGLAARGRDIPIFGAFNLPIVTPLSFDLSNSATTLHIYSQYALYVLVVLHVAAALWHHFILKDDVMRRMLPGKTALQSDTR
ncbi:MAG: cytochrome b [Rhodospirillaceae bacterium]